MKRMRVVTLSFALLMVVFASMASATVVNVAQWRCGEDDGDHIYYPDSWVNPTAVDVTGNHNLNNNNGAIVYAYPADYPTGLPVYPYPNAGLPASSSVDYAWAGNAGGFTSATPIATGAQNWGVQLWVRPNQKQDQPLEYGIYFQNGFLDQANDITLFQMDWGALGGTAGEFHYFAEVSGASGGLLMGPVVDTANWHNLAFVNNAGTATLYVDGAAVSSVAGVSAATPGEFLGLGVGASGGLVGGMLGGIDEARVFTFQPGAFHVSDLGFAPVPEPSAVIILATGLFGLLAYAWRKRK